MAGFFASTIESYGDYHACAAALGEPMPDKRRIGRGIGMEGLACSINGVFGGIATTSLTENIGIIGLTGVGARRVVWVAGIQMIIFGVIGKVGGVFATLPNAVLGGAWLIVFGLVVGYGVQWMSKGGLSEVRNVAIVGICLLVGLGVPQLLAAKPILIGGVSDKGLAGILNAFLAVPMVNGGILAIVLEHILPGRMSHEKVEAVLKGQESGT
jgi:xanthine/uracil permease